MTDAIEKDLVWLVGGPLSGVAVSVSKGIGAVNIPLDGDTRFGLRVGESQVAKYVRNERGEYVFHEAWTVEEPSNPIDAVLSMQEDLAALRAENERLREALQDMVDMIDSGDEHGDGSPWHIKAKAALASEGQGGG